METLITLLRAVNVGGTGKMTMADLRSIAEKAGFSEVRTYIQSGNLIFSTSKAPPIAKSMIEKKLAEYAGKPIGVILRTAQEMQDVLEANPFTNAEPSKVGVLFLNDPPPPDTVETAKGQVDEDIELGGSEIFIHYPSGMGRTKLRLMAMSEGTTRNINTVGKLAKMAADAQGIRRKAAFGYDLPVRETAPLAAWCLDSKDADKVTVHGEPTNGRFNVFGELRGGTDSWKELVSIIWMPC